MKMLILCDHFPVSPRLLKVTKSIKDLYPNMQIEIVAWNRGNVKNTTFINTVDTPIGYGNKFKKLTNLFAFYKSVKRFVQEYKPDIIYAIDFEMFVIASILKSNEEIIYEVYDIKFFSNKAINTVREKLEMKYINKHKPKMIFASPFFINYYADKVKYTIKQITLNNKPSKSISTPTFVEKAPQNNDELVIGFIGVVRYKELIQNLLTASSRLSNIKVLIAGDGPDLQLIKEFVQHNNISNVQFSGRYTIDEIKAIYDTCDFVWAAYPYEDLNVKYAISNKFFESLAYNKPVIVSKNTLLGELVENENLGIIIDPYSVEEIYVKLEQLNRAIIINSNSNLNLINGKYWEDEEHKLRGFIK